MDKPKRRPGRGLLLEAQHQLRQPLNALSLLIGELRQGPSGRELEAIAEDMRYALQLSNTWLNSLADLETAEQGLLELDVQAVRLQPIFEQLRADFAPRFAEHGLVFRVVPARAEVRADAEFLRRLITLLLDNAIKFTPKGKVLLGCRRRPGGRLRIEVWDSGLGIDPAQAARLFEPFYRLENEVRPRERGLGLGLAYARRLAELNDDQMTVRSRPGRGSCFALTLRLAAGGTEGPGREGLAADAGTPAAAIHNPLEDAEVPVLAGPETPGLRALLESWGATVSEVAAADLAAALAAQPRLLIADRAGFSAAGGWDAAGAQETTVVLVSDWPADPTDPREALVHTLLRPVKPARLRALCHFALTRGAETPESE